MRTDVRKSTVPYFVVLSFILTACGGKEMEKGVAVVGNAFEVGNKSWERVASKRIYFGHQSVGQNIIEGLRDVERMNPDISLRISEAEEVGVPRGNGLVHGRIGANGQPAEKIRDFVRIAGRNGGAPYDIAAMKLCYADFTSDTDVEALLSTYTRGMDELKSLRPGLRIVHVTVPLTTSRPGWKSLAKRIIGRKDIGYLENVKRNDYNERMRERYLGREPVFDLAKIESTREDGTPVAFLSDGKTYACMNSDYTDDGGHLNAKGRKVVASQLLALFAELAEQN